MSLMRCRSCTCRFAVGLLRCPQCQQVSELYAQPEHEAEAEEENMPKITVGGGASNALGAAEDAGAEQPAFEIETAEESVADGAEDPTVEPVQETAAIEADATPAAKEAAPAPKTRKKATPAAN